MTILPDHAHPLVRAAIADIDHFGAVTLHQARALLGMWGRRDQLTDAQVAEVLGCYIDGGTIYGDPPEAAPDPVPPLRQPGYVTSHRAGTR